MTNERFNELLRGALCHPLIHLQMMRLAVALREVVEATGAAGEQALEEHCRQRDEQDRRDEADY